MAHSDDSYRIELGLLSRKVSNPLVLPHRPSLGFVDFELEDVLPNFEGDIPTFTTVPTTPRRSSVASSVMVGTSSKRRRVAHLLSEKRRRAEMNDHFDRLQSELGLYGNSKISKCALLGRAVELIRAMKSRQRMLETRLASISLPRLPGSM